MDHASGLFTLADAEGAVNEHVAKFRDHNRAYKRACGRLRVLRGDPGANPEEEPTEIRPEAVAEQLDAVRNAWNALKEHCEAANWKWLYERSSTGGYQVRKVDGLSLWI